MIKLLIGGSPCFTEGHLIFTEKGLVPIESVKVGDYVLTHNNRYRMVTDVGCKYAETFNLKTRGVPDFVVTENHPFYIREMKRCFNSKERTYKRLFDEPKWVEVKDLNKNHFCGSPIIQKEENPLNLTEELCWLLGRYVADGHIRKSKRLKRKNSYMYQVVYSVGEKKVEDFKKMVRQHHVSCYEHSKSVYRCVIPQKELVEFIERHDFGIGAKNKNIPNLILNLPVDLAKTFLMGYLSGDGHRSNTWGEKYSATTVSKRLAYSLALLVQKVYKVNASISYKAPNSTTVIEGRIVNQSPQYIISFKTEMPKQAIAEVIDDIVWTRCEERQPNNRQLVYNISVDEDESYVCNNRIVHNCTHWSIAQSKNRETKAQGIGWDLFENYSIANRKFQPNFFLYENNWSASKEIKTQIQEELDCELMRINSKLVSAQNRDRFYVFNWDVEQPEDRGILLRDILETGETWAEKSYAITTRCCAAIPEDTLKRHRHTMVAEPMQEAITSISSRHKDRIKKHKEEHRESYCLRYERTEEAKRLRKDYEAGKIHHGYHEFHELHPRTDGKTNTLTTVLKDNQIIETAKNNYATIYEVRNGLITINGKTYPIKLKDGYYIIRKLTPVECERLQTMPDGYTAAVSNTQRYKGLGNGWTAEVIIHILNGVLKDVPRDEKIVVLSMYDGIGTGRYCLDKMGFTNVEYHAYEIDKYAIKVAISNYPDIIQHGDAFQVREDDWHI